MFALLFRRDSSDSFIMATYGPVRPARFDALSPDVLDNPYPVYKRLRDAGRVARVPARIAHPVHRAMALDMVPNGGVRRAGAQIPRTG